MPGLRDIANTSPTVTVQGQPVTVSGVSARGIAVLLERFPPLRELFAGKAPQIDPATVMKLVPEAVACIIACGTGAPGDLEAEKIADSLVAGDQLDLLSKIIEVTMPRGFGPFVEKVETIAAIMGAESMNIPDMKSPRPSSP